MGSTGPSSPKLVAVLIDDDPAHLELLRLAIEEHAPADLGPLNIQCYTDAAAALANLPAGPPAVIVCDNRMPGATGVEWLGDFVRADVGPVIIVSGIGSEDVVAAAFRQGAADYLPKAAVIEDPYRLCASIRESLRRFKLEHSNQELDRKLKIANKELNRKNATLRELTKTAERFVENVAHEFRTPLAVIKEFASIITDGLGGDVTPKQGEYLKFIMDATGDLTSLVDDFLDSSKLRARALPIHRRSHQVAAILEAIRPILESRAARKRIRIVEELAPDITSVLADHEKVQRVIVNLVVNAVKVAPPESEIRITAREEANGGVRIAVCDQGPGLDKEQQSVIFDRFRQVGEMTRSTEKGFGLGLTIAKEMVWVNLGVMDVQSEPGKGSTFSFTLPPADYRVVLEQYLMLQREADPHCWISMLEARPENAGGIQEIAEFFSEECYPTDLVIPDPDTGVLTIIGVTVQPDNWVNRLREVHRERMRDDPEGAIGPLHLRIIGSWLVEEASEPMQRIRCLGRRSGEACLHPS